MERRANTCPCCHRPFPPELAVGGSVRQRLVDIVANRPDGVTRSELLDCLYANDPNGGPDYPNTISVLIHFANIKLNKLGYRIKGSGGPGSRYFLETLGADSLSKSSRHLHSREVGRA